MRIKTKIKKIVIILVAALTMCSTAAIASPVFASSNVSSYRQNDLSLDVKSALAIDSNSGQILYAQNANKILPIASMTKLITVYLTLQAIKNKQISWNTKVTPTDNIVKVANNSEYSNVPLKKGHSYTIRQLYQATLIESANGAAMCLAKAVAGSQEAFVKQMRTQVKKWGITDAKLYTVCGLPNGNVGSDAYSGVSKDAENLMSARDMAIVGQRLIDDFPAVLNTTKIAKMNFKDGNQTTQMSNFNWMLKGLSQYDANLSVDGLKTGTTDKAGACFIGTAVHQGGRIITVVMGARHQDGTDPSRFIQTKRLMRWIYKNYNAINLNAGSTLGKAQSVRVADGKQLDTNVGLKSKTTIWDPVDGKNVTASLTKKTADAPINKGQVISQYQFKSGSDKLVSLEQPNGMRVDAQALSANSKANVFVRFWRWITGVR